MGNVNEQVSDTGTVPGINGNKKTMIVVSFNSNFYSYDILPGENFNKLIERFCSDIEEKTGTKVNKPIKIERKFNKKLCQQVWILSEAPQSK